MLQKLRNIGQFRHGAGSDIEALRPVRLKIVSDYRRTAGWVYDQCRF